MARTTELITTAEVKSLAIVNANLDTAYLDQYILTAQRHYIREFISKEFYEELQTQVAAETLTTNNTNVLVYIKRALAHYVVYESLPQLKNQIAKGGVYNNISATGETATDKGFSDTRQDYLAKAEREREEIDYYIKQIREDDATAYPLYSKSAKQNSGIIFY